MPIKRELSLALVGLAGGLLVGNFAAFNGFLALANSLGDQIVTWLLTGSTVLLTFSIILGGRGISLQDEKAQKKKFNSQAWAGLFALIAALAMPVSAMVLLEQPDEKQSSQISVLRQAQAGSEAERSALKAALDGANAELARISQAVDQLRSDFDALPAP